MAETLFFLAEDDLDDQILFMEAVTALNVGVSCEMAMDGEQAIDKLKNRKGRLPDCIFLDLNMPKMDGLQCLYEIRKIKTIAQVPAIIYSTTISNTVIEQGRKLGAMAFFNKPTSLTAFSHYLKRVMDKLASTK